MSYAITESDKNQIYQSYGVKITSENGVIKYSGSERQKEIVSGIINKKVFLAKNSHVKLDSKSKKGSISENLYDIGLNALFTERTNYRNNDFNENQASYTIS